MLFEKRKTYILGGLTVILALVSFWLLEIHQRKTIHKLEQLALLQQIVDTTDTIVADTYGVLQSNTLSRIQANNGDNIARFQLLVQGSLKRDLPAFLETYPEHKSPLTEKFNGFTDQVSSLIRQRMSLEKLQQNRNSMIQSAQNLADRAQALSKGITQIEGSMEHLQAAFRVTIALQENASNVVLTYYHHQKYPGLVLNALQADLASLSTDRQAPDSAAIRRSAMNLSADLANFQEASEQLSDQQRLMEAIHTVQTELAQANETLNAAFNNAILSLYQGGNGLWFMGLFGVILTVLSALATGTTLPATPSTTPVRAKKRQVFEDDLTKPSFQAQLKTERNLLINDIKPLSQGILYIKADEHLETTTEIALWINKAREYFIQTFEQLQAQVTEMEAVVENPPAIANEANPVQEQTDANLLVDLIFKAQAEVDGVLRRLNGSSEATTAVEQLTQRLLNTDQLLDELRIRIKKEQSDRRCMPGDPAIALHETRQLALMMTDLKNSLEAVKTAAPPPRRKRRPPV